MVCGVILSGGLSRRFQRSGEPWLDKALYIVNGKPMIKSVFDALSEIADHIVIAVNNAERIISYRNLMPGAMYVIDDDRLRGPLAGIYSALTKCDDDYVVIVPNDMPFITSKAIKPLIRELVNFEATTYILPNGHIENALMAMRRDEALRYVELLIEYSRSKTFDIIRGLPRVLFMNPLNHDVELRELVNINKRDDVEKGNKKLEEGGEVSIKNDISIIRNFTLNDVVSKNFESLAGSLWYTIIVKDPWPEFRLYAEAGLHFLAAHVLLDSINENVRWLGRRLLSSFGVDKA
ncbi:MAG: molybdenum cofactor guanylyltransferase [Vulcanisaeta sp.]